MTAKAFADTNIAIYSEGSDTQKAQRATAILESTPVIRSGDLQHEQLFEQRLRVVNPFAT